jgi:hypothetical protein
MVVLVCLVGTASAGDYILWGAGCGLGFNRMKRGLVESDGPFARPTAQLTAGALMLTGWTVFDLAPAATSEAGVSLGAELPIERLLLEPEVRLTAPAEAAWRPEFGFGVSVSYPLLGPVRASFTTTVDDVSLQDANSVGLGFKTESLALGPVALDFGASVGWGSAEYHSVEYGVNQGKLDLVEVDAAGEYRPWKYLAIRPTLTFATILDHQLRAGISGRQSPTNVSATLEFEVGLPEEPAEGIED